MIANKKHVTQPKLNIRRAILIIATVGWVQVIMALALALMYFMAGDSVPSTILLVLLVALILFGNYVLMRRALGILNAEREMAEVEATLDSATELNRKLRSQRHDFMNHLQVVYGLMELGDYTEACEYIDRVYKDIQNVSRLIRTDNAAVNALLSAKAEEATERGLELEFDIRSRATDLALEPWEFCGILGNIMDNAMDALDGKAGGKIRVLLWEELGGFNFAIENNGPPIPDGIAEQIFEPGFTTKGENGQGLGLHIVRDTLERYGGSVAVTQIGEWTRFSGAMPKTSDVRRLSPCNN